jgi:hypothetical protein
MNLDDEGTRFTPGKHQYLILVPAQKQQRIIQTFIEIASAKPVPKQSRSRRQQQEQQPPQKPVELAKLPRA